MPRLTSGGRVTIPLRIRAALGLQAGDRVEFVKTENGEFLLVPLINNVRETEGSLRRKNVKQSSLRKTPPPPATP